MKVGDLKNALKGYRDDDDVAVRQAGKSHFKAADVDTVYPVSNGNGKNKTAVVFTTDDRDRKHAL